MYLNIYIVHFEIQSKKKYFVFYVFFTPKALTRIFITFINRRICFSSWPSYIYWEIFIIVRMNSIQKIFIRCAFVYFPLCNQWLINYKIFPLRCILYEYYIRLLILITCTCVDGKVWIQRLFMKIYIANYLAIHQIYP